MDDKRNGFSFGFKKKQDSVQLGKSIVSEDVDKEDKEKDYVLSLEGKEVKSTKRSDKPAKQEYVIPLIKHNKWRRGGTGKVERFLNGSSENKYESAAQDNLDEQAAKEVLEDTAKYNEEWSDRGKEDTHFAIPLLVQNKIPEGFESDDKLDVALRPDEPNDTNYEQIPIEHFGLAMLRGMGWSKEKGIGKNSKVIAPVEAHIRPKGLGLGADRSNSGSDKNSAQDSVPDNEKEELELKRNAFCVVIAGKDKDLYGTIEGIDEDNSRIMVKLALSGKVINIMQSTVRIVGKQEFEKYSKYLNKQKTDEYKTKERNKMENENEEKSKSDNRDKRSIPLDSDSRPKRFKHEGRSSRENGEQKTKHSNREERNGRDSKYKTQSNSRIYSSEEGKNASVSWLRNDLRVRIIDKELNRGKYYKEKVVIVDVPCQGKCVCKTDDGQVIDNVPQSSLETVVPRLENAYVSVVGSSHSGQIGQIMKRDKDRCVALVQLLIDRDIVLKLSYDDICEFVGDIHQHEDY